MNFISKIEQDTIDFAKKFVKKLKGGEILSLEGDLGTGKTVFTKGLAKGLCIKKIIKSPTFVLMKVYPVTKHKTIKHLVHLDAYRLDDFSELENIGIDEYLNGENVVVIEWGDKVKKNLPKKTKSIKFKIQNNFRKINY